MRRAARSLAACAVLLAAAWAARAQEPADGAEDLAEAASVLAAADQPLADGDLEDLLGSAGGAGETAAPPVTVRLRWQADTLARRGADADLQAGGGAWDLRLRARRSPAGQGLTAGTGSLGRGPWRLRAGGWTWGHGFGLLAGGAGRSPSVAADGGLGPREGGFRGWTGWTEAQAARGLAAGFEGAGWRTAVAWGRGGPDDLPRALATVGRCTGAWRLTFVHGGASPPAWGADGRWRRGAWSGGWEAAQVAGSGARPALAAQVAWAAGRPLRAEALAAVSPDGAARPPDARTALLGAAAGAGWALRLRWSPVPGVGLAALAATAAAAQRRTTTDILGRAGLGSGLELGARLRTTARTERSWSPEWPWTPPQESAGRRTQALTLCLAGPARTARWRVTVRSLAVDHSATSGRRTMVAAEFRSAGRGGPSWRLAWRWAWGDPVDLVDAASPLPGLLVPRHWGAWSGGWFGRLGLPLGRLGLDAAADLRTAADGRRRLEAWAGVTAAW